VRQPDRTGDDHGVGTPEDTAEGRRLIEAGAPVAGSMAGAAAGVVFDSGTAAVQIDPQWAVCLRAAAGEAAAVRVPRERVRAGAVLAFAVEHTVTLGRNGRSLRGDDFFAGRPGARAAAGEVLESVVGAARRAADERRVRHLGYLLAEVACSADLDADLVGQALRHAEALSWRQLALLAGVGRRDRVHLPIAPLEPEPRGWSGWGAREDVTDLQRAGLVDPPLATDRPGGAVQPRLRMADLRLTRRGVLVHRLFALDFVREEAVAAALADLGLPRS
jgi:hypothetical protein